MSKIKVLQLKTTDYFTYLRCFYGDGEYTPNKENYETVFEGDLGTQELEEIFHIFNVNHPEGYKGRSMSTSDIVETENGCFLCESIGWRELK